MELPEKFKDAKTKQLSILNTPLMAITDGRYNGHYWEYAARGEWEPFTYFLFKTILKRNMCMLDFGSWIGVTAIFAAHYAGHVYSLEPDPVAYEYLRASLYYNLHLRQRISVYDYCISGKNGTVKMTGSKGNSSPSITRKKGEENPTDIEWDVQCLTLSDFMKKENILRFDFIKMDCEGCELFVIPTMKEYILKEKPDIWLSFHSLFLKENKKKKKMK